MLEEEKRSLKLSAWKKHFKGKEKYYFNILKSCFEIKEKKKGMYLDATERDKEKNSSPAQFDRH